MVSFELLVIYLSISIEHFLFPIKQTTHLIWLIFLLRSLLLFIIVAIGIMYIASETSSVCLNHFLFVIISHTKLQFSHAHIYSFILWLALFFFWFNNKQISELFRHFRFSWLQIHHMLNFYCMYIIVLSVQEVNEDDMSEISLIRCVGSFISAKNS